MNYTKGLSILLIILMTALFSACVEELFNKPPVIKTFTASPETIAKGEQSIITVDAYDPNLEDELTYTFVIADGHGTIIPYEPPMPIDVAIYTASMISETVTIQVTAKAGGDSVSQNLEVEVTDSTTGNNDPADLVATWELSTTESVDSYDVTTTTTLVFGSDDTYSITESKTSANPAWSCSPDVLVKTGTYRADATNIWITLTAGQKTNPDNSCALEAIASEDLAANGIDGVESAELEYTVTSSSLSFMNKVFTK